MSPAVLDPVKVDFSKYTLKEWTLLCAGSFKMFCRVFLAGHFSEHFAPFHSGLIQDLQTLKNGKHLLKLVPRDHGKSTVVSFAYVLWCVCYRKRRYIGVISSTSGNAERFLGKIRMELEQNEVIRKAFGDLVGDTETGGAKKQGWRHKYLRTTNQVAVFSASTGGALRGANESFPDDLPSGYVTKNRYGQPIYNNLVSVRPDLLILDDIIEDKHVKSVKVRESLWDWFWGALSNVPSLGVGNIIVIGTTVHEDDLVMRLWKDKRRTTNWIKTKQPACEGFTEQGLPINPLWEQKYGAMDPLRPIDEWRNPLTESELAYRQATNQPIYYLPYLSWKLRDLGSRAFQKEFMLEPVDDATKYVHRAWIKYWVRKGEELPDNVLRHLEMNNLNLEVLPDDLICITSLDPAGSRGKRAEEADNDFTAIVTQGYSIRTRKYYLLDVDRVRTTMAGIMMLMFKHYVYYSNRVGASYWGSGTVGKGVAEEAFAFHHLGFLVESVAFQKALADSLNELSIRLGFHAPVYEVKRGNNSKTTRALGVSPIFERGEWAAPFNLLPGQRNPSVDAAIDELCAFPSGAHDDCVDSIVDGLAVLQRMSFNVSRGLGAQAALEEMVRSNPALYAKVEHNRQETDNDFHQAYINARMG